MYKIVPWSPSPKNTRNQVHDILHEAQSPSKHGSLTCLQCFGNFGTKDCAPEKNTYRDREVKVVVGVGIVGVVASSR